MNEQLRKKDNHKHDFKGIIMLFNFVRKDINNEKQVVYINTNK